MGQSAYLDMKVEGESSMPIKGEHGKAVTVWFRKTRLIW
jgi:hypothetical protein